MNPLLADRNREIADGQVPLIAARLTKRVDDEEDNMRVVRRVPVIALFLAQLILPGGPAASSPAPITRSAKQPMSLIHAPMATNVPETPDGMTVKEIGNPANLSGSRSP